MELDLQAARAEREVEDLVKVALSRLPIAGQKNVLQRVAIDVLAAHDAERLKGRSDLSAPTTKGTAGARPALALVRSLEGDNRSQWERILAYCETHPTPNGEHRVVDVGRAVFADKLQANKSGAMAAVHTAISRRTAKGGAANPTFVLTGRGTFRLATPAERANEGTRLS